jgi:hypothetical protein
MSGVPPPFKNLIGQQALTEWEKPENWYMIPEDSKILAKWKTEQANKKIAQAEKKRQKIKPKVRPDNVKKKWPFAFSIGALIFLL